MGSPAFLGPLALVLLAALAAAWLVHRVRQPPLVGFLGAGVLLGPYGLGLVSDVAAVEILAEVGVVLLLFTVGLDLSVSTLKRLSRNVWIAGPIQFAGVIALAVEPRTPAGLSLALGAFLAGVVVSESDFGHQAVADIAPFRDAFSALFFVSVGMLFDARVIVQRPGVVAAVLGLVLVGKAVVGGLPPLLLGYGPRVAIVVGVSLAQIGEFAFVLLEAARRAGGVDRTEYQVILAATIISMVATPLLFEQSHRLAWRLTGGRAGSGGTVPATDAEIPEGHVVILGFGHTGETLARVLGRAKVPFRILELNPERVAKARGKGLPVEYGDASNDRVLRHAGIDRARAVLVLISDPRATRRSVRLIREIAPKTYLIARTRYLTEIPDLVALGADEVVAEEFETSLEISGRTLKKPGFPLPWVEAEADEIRRVRHEKFKGFDSPV